MGATVLVVDDEPLILTSICRLIDDMDIDILTAENAEEALDLCSNTKVDVMLTDQCMPGMSGIELLKKVQGSSPATVGILMSGKKECPEANEELAAGMLHCYIRKPWNPRELIEAIDTAIKKQP